jgi:hypothetical protein
MLLKMLSYRRPAFSGSEESFIRRFIEPTGATRDEFGNLILKIGENPTTLFSSHTDSVHSTPGRQLVDVINGVAVLHRKERVRECLGADCATGVYIMLKLIEAKVPGLYIFHRAEEIGCQGSDYIARYTPELLQDIKHAIAFDRRGRDSIVTHQCGRRTASDEFAWALSEIAPNGMHPDSSGIFTDTNEYRSLIPECTNISVGYTNQHSARESQCLAFPNILVRKLVRGARLLSDLPAVRPTTPEPWINSNSYDRGWSSYYGDWLSGKGNTKDPYDDAFHSFSDNSPYHSCDMYASRDDFCAYCFGDTNQGDPMYLRLGEMVCENCSEVIDGKWQIVN